jgi:hypothetical protein
VVDDPSSEEPYCERSTTPEKRAVDPLAVADDPGLEICPRPEEGRKRDDELKPGACPTESYKCWLTSIFNYMYL